MPQLTLRGGVPGRRLRKPGTKSNCAKDDMKVVLLKSLSRPEHLGARQVQCSSAALRPP